MSNKQKVDFTIENGTTVTSNISGFTGIVTSRAQHLHSCNRYFVHPRVDKDGKIPDGYWFDEAELVHVSDTHLKPKNTHRGGFHSKIK